MPLPPYQPPDILEHRTPPPPPEYGYPPLGIILILRSPGRSPQNTGLDPMSLGNHLRSVLINAIGSDTFLHVPTETKYIEIRIRRNMIKDVKIEAPSFDGQLDPTKFLDWLADMDHYFEWYDMSNGRRVRFAKIKFLGQVKLYWTNNERLMAR